HAMDALDFTNRRLLHFHRPAFDRDDDMGSAQPQCGTTRLDHSHVHHPWRPPFHRPAGIGLYLCFLACPGPAQHVVDDRHYLISHHRPAALGMRYQQTEFGALNTPITVGSKIKSTPYRAEKEITS